LIIKRVFSPAVKRGAFYCELQEFRAIRGWPKIDAAKFLAELKKSLKPGGMLGVIDHSAEAGSPRATGGTLHRIDPQIVISEIEAAGFVLESASDVLRNMNDDYSLGVFHSEVRAKTDRFVVKFRKPDWRSVPEPGSPIFGAICDPFPVQRMAVAA